jgi:alanyl-tRNA synthetase
VYAYCFIDQGVPEKEKQKAKEKIPILLEQVASQTSSGVIDEIEINVNKIKSCFTNSNQYDEFFHMNFGKKLVKDNPNSAYVGIFESGPTIRVIAYSGDEASKSKNAGIIAKSVAEILGGAGGGDAKFAQGGGKDISKINDAIAKAKSMILG